MSSRRSFSAFAGALCGAPLIVAAQGGQPVEGRHYQAVTPRQPTLDAKRVEAIEFFAYSCHHCHDFEPALDAWQKKLPAHVLFRRVPVAFRQEAVPHMAMYFAVESLGLVDRLHRQMFEVVHANRDAARLPQEVMALVAKNGLDPTAFVATMTSQAVTARIRQAIAMADAYKIEGTPTIAVDGRWLTHGALAGGNPASLAVADFLIQQARKAR